MNATAVSVTALTALVLVTAPAAAQDGAAVFAARCATCHTSNSDTRVPTVASLRQRAPESIVEALATGVMRQQASELSATERRAVAEYLAGRPMTPASPADSAPGRCTTPPRFDAAAGVPWGSWGPDPSNSRFQPQPGFTAEQVPQLKLKWAFGFEGASGMRALPTLAGGRVYIGSQSGAVYALDANSGCVVWTFHAKAGVRSPVVIGPGRANIPAVAYFGDGRSNVYALNADTGAQLWSRPVEDHPNSHVTGAPALNGNRLYVPVSSGEEGQGNNAKYECCTFRGSIVALDAVTGALAWKTYTIANEPRPLGKNRSGTTRWGPSGAAIWASPTVDTKRGLLYAATGNMYTEPQQGTAEAVIAFRLATGEIAWSAQLTPKDVFVVGCNQPNAANCGDDVGPDFDFGNAPMLVTRADGTDAIVIGQKSGVGWGLDPDRRGAVLWQYRAGDGSALGGMEFGSAADREKAYFPVADGNGPHAGELHAVNLVSGERAWFAPQQPVKCGARGRGCTPAILAAITATPGAVFAGAQDGGLRAYASTDGTLLWEFDTNREFTTVNGVAARGASMSGPGPVVGSGMVFVGSGYGSLGGRPGNVLLAFGVD